MKKVEFTQTVLNEMSRFKSGKQQLAFKILDLIEDIQKNPFTGLGKPEALKGNFQGYWSRRINDEHRLVYKVSDTAIEIYKCFGHYDD
jgi:toxin YoeB